MPTRNLSYRLLNILSHCKRLKLLSIFFGRGAREITGSKNQKVREVYILPYCRLALAPPNFMKFVVRGQLTDIITFVKFLVNRFWGYGVLTPQIAISH